MAIKQMPHGTYGFDRRPLQIGRPAQVFLFFSRRLCFSNSIMQVDDIISRHQALPYPKPLDPSRCVLSVCLNHPDSGFYSACSVTAAFGILAASKFTRLLDHPDNKVVEDDLKCIEQHVLGHSSRATNLLHCNCANVITNLLFDSRRSAAVKEMAGRCLAAITECEAAREALAPQPIVMQVGWWSFRSFS
jgi:hypothetical protein